MSAIGHTRYSTAGGSQLAGAQPFVLETDLGMVAIAHNGQLARQEALRRIVLARGTGLFTTSDSELIAQTLARPHDVSLVQSLLQELRLHAREPLDAATVAAALGGAAGGGALDPSAPLWPAWFARIAAFMHECEGAYSFVALTKDAVYAVRDVYGLRPLCLGRLLEDDGTTSYFAASESCALATIGADFVREVAPGEIVRIDAAGLHSYLPFERARRASAASEAAAAIAAAAAVGLGSPDEAAAVATAAGGNGGASLALALPRAGSPPNSPSSNSARRLLSGGAHASASALVLPPPPREPALCIFEYVYFARPDSILEGQMVHSVRTRLGARLAREAPAPGADLISGVPDSSIAAAIGFATECGLPFSEVFCKNRYIARTFIKPDNALRKNAIQLKYNPLSHVLAGKRVVLVDDSLVRGNTLAQLVPLLRRGGALEVHIRICSPPIKHPCYMGVNIGTYEELIAHNIPDVEMIRRHIGADSLAYLSQDGMTAAVREGVIPSAASHGAELKVGHCSACFTGGACTRRRRPRAHACQPWRALLRDAAHPPPTRSLARPPPLARAVYPLAHDRGVSACAGERSW